jgi:hypothetical protein
MRTMTRGRQCAKGAACAPIGARRRSALGARRRSALGARHLPPDACRA